MKLYSLGYGGKACYFDLSSDGEPRYLASSSTNSNEDEDGSCWLGFGFEKGTDIYVAHEQTKLPGGEITSGLGTVTQKLYLSNTILGFAIHHRFFIRALEVGHGLGRQE